MSGNDGLVYIVLINYNGFDDTIDCVESIRGNKYKNYKIVIVDNHSTDDSQEKLKDTYSASSDVILILSDANLGFSGGNNLGIKRAIEDKADYVMLLNNDTIIDERCIERLVSKSKQHEDSAFITGKILYYYEPKKIWFAGGEYEAHKGSGRHFGVGEIDRGQFNEEKELSFVCGCLVLMSRKCVESVGLMPEEYFLYGEDTAYSLEVTRKGLKIFYEPEAVIYHKVSASTSKISNLTGYYVIRNRLYIIKKYNQGISKQTAYVSTTLHVIKGIVKGKYKVQTMRKAYADFRKGNMGRVEIG